MDLNKYRALFVEESRDHLSQLSSLVLGLENSADSRGAIDACFRHVHSVKGMAAAMGYDPITELSHRFEDVIDGYRRAARPVGTQATDTFLRTVDALVALVEAVDRQEGLSEQTELMVELSAVSAEATKHRDASKAHEAPLSRSRDHSAPTLRVKIDSLDRLIDGIGELFIVREQLRRLVEPYRGNGELRGVLDVLDRRVRELHNEALNVRMTPLRTLTGRYPRIVRDLARSLDKDIDFQVEGDEIELDRAILEALDSPFLHTVRNAVDHGIESVAERQACGKSARAQLRLTASRDRDTVVVSIKDDGRGLDPEKLIEIAIQRGLIEPQRASELSAREAYFLICLPGFSTKESVTDVSGRGVGMDVVRSEIEKLSGTLDIESAKNKGTSFFFRLPLTLAIIHALVVQAAGGRFAIPVAKIIAVREMGEDVVDEAGGARYLSFRHALAPIVFLAEVLGLGARSSEEQLVVFEDGRDLAALAVERVMGYHEIVVKPLGEPLDRLAWYSGATVLGDGEPILILDPVKLLRVDSGVQLRHD